jgi:hypothetical protein
VTSSGTPSGPGDDDDLGVEIPDDLSGLDDLGPAATDGRAAPLEPEEPQQPEEPVVAILVTQVAGARPLAAACSLAGVDVDAVASPVGALAVLRDARDAATTAAAAAAVSGILRTSPVVLLDRRAGRIAASRWVAGEREDDLPPGLVMSGAPEVLDDLLVGGKPVTEVEGVETSVGMTRWAAVRALSGGRRRKG